LTQHPQENPRMDLREIQRLHAQFAPDSMTIDLPRQIAALPAPVAFDEVSKSSSLTPRLTKVAPLLRSCGRPLLIAAVVAMAGVGAARVWHSVGASSTPNNSGVEKVAPEKSRQAAQLAVAGEPEFRPIDATPARPIAAVPMLSASDLANAPAPGLTAEQFRRSVGAASSDTLAKTSSTGAVPSASDQTKLAASSPIRQSHRDSEVARVVATPQSHTAQPQVVKAESKLAAQPTEQTQANTVAASAVSTTSGTTVPVPTQDSVRDPLPAQPVAHTHSFRHHAARPRDEQSSEADAAAMLPKKPAPASRAGSNEVQMF
jgi:hypothetical protein